ncbi:secreted protein [Candidatus Thiomargarita nelsonii]|uniref:Secreted protein n=1 Tax=Candidatus Thiomargarita nelsonii TaxID=1003181 RepID=A0A176S490_9GAMM|nr:secreted protein [Candidatus Thiomargarita nelsonii]
MKMTKTAPLFLAAWVLMPSASIAIEDCGTSVTECRIKQDIKDLQLQNKAQQQQIDTQRRKIGELAAEKQTTINTQQGQIGELAAENKKQQATINTQQRKIGELVAKTEKQQATIDTQQGLIDAQKKQLDSLQKRIPSNLEVSHGFGGMEQFDGNEIWTLAMYGKTIEDQGHSYIIALNNEFFNTDNGCQKTCKKYDSRFVCRGFTYLGCGWGLKQPGTSKCDSDGNHVCQPRVCLCSL